jgi:hypothetical protein
LFLWNISGSFTFSGIVSQFEESDGGNKHIELMI